jgi:hypothetical protein
MAFFPFFGKIAERAQGKVQKKPKRIAAMGIAPVGLDLVNVCDEVLRKADIQGLTAYPFLKIHGHTLRTRQCNICVLRYFCVKINRI